MDKNEKKILNIKNRMQGLVTMPNQAVEIAYEIFLLSHKTNKHHDNEVKELISEYLEKLRQWDLSDILDNQIHYAIRLAETDSELLGEEMLKLFSLCEDIDILEYLGLNSKESLKMRLKKVVSYRIESEKEKARLAVLSAANDNNKDKWWYKEAVS